MNTVEISGVIVDVQYEDNYQKILRVKNMNGDFYHITCQIYCKVYKLDCIYALCTLNTLGNGINNVGNKNYFTILGLNMDASLEDIKSAYKKNAIMYHPDKNDGNDEQFKLCLEAYECLQDSKLRTEHIIECKKQKEYYSPLKSPFILMATDENAIIIGFVRILSIVHKEAAQFYYYLTNLTENVYEYVTDLAEAWHHQKDTSILNMFGDFDYNIEVFLEKWYQDFNLRQLNLLGLSNKEVKCIGMRCNDLYRQCLENPYTIYTIGIDKADDIMIRMNKTINKVDRERGFIARRMWDNTDGRKWMATPTKYLSDQFKGIKGHVDKLKQDYHLVVDDGLAYLKRYYEMEVEVANYVTACVKGVCSIDYDVMYSRDDLSQDQQDAIQGALQHKLAFICGGPGVGKSTIIAELVHNFESHQIKYALTSFTGKAVCKIQEVTKTDIAKTMHRLINDAKKTRAHYETKVVIIDEISMVTLELLHKFLKLYNHIEQLICIGDVNQLQPIDAGCFLGEIVKANVVPIYYLTTNHRVVVEPGKVDGILSNAHLIIHHNKDYPFEFIEADNFTIMEGTMEDCLDLVRVAHKSGISCKQMTVLTPYNIWVDLLNKGCQEIFHHHDPYVEDSRGIKWYLGDRVMLTKNIRSINVFNGQQGYVKAIDNTFITVVFDHEENKTNKTITYNDNDVNNGIKEHIFMLEAKSTNKHVDDEEDDYDTELSVLKLQHSYATTITKSQGSEFDLVILFIPPDAKDNSFLNKSLYYTAITRSKRFCYVIVPYIQLLLNGVVRAPLWRCEGLSKRLMKALPKIRKPTSYEDDYYGTEYTDADYDQ